MENNNLIVIKQLPIIEEKLKQLSTEIDEKVESAKALICTEESVKEVKTVRADLNKDFKELEAQRKDVKEKIMQPYMQFESIYKECVSDKFKSADIELKNKIDTVENELKLQKEKEIKEYFEEYRKANEIDFINFEDTKVTITLSASKKSLKEQVKNFIDKVVDDLNLIETQNHKEEILVEYKQNLNVSKSISTVLNRIEAVEEEKKRQEELKENKETVIEENKQEKLEKEFSKEMRETEINQKKYTITFKVTDSAIRLKQLKDYLIREGYQYE